MGLGIGKWLVKLDAAAYVIDCNWNMYPAEITANTGSLVSQIRAARPAVPIVLAEGTPDGLNWVLPSNSTGHQEQNNAAFRAAWLELVRSGVPGLHYVESSELYSAVRPVWNPTVGGCHPSDFGALAMTYFYAGFLPRILNRSERGS